MSEEQKVKDGQVVSMEYTLKVDGKVTDTSEGREPLAYLQGSGNIIPGLERELAGMKIGESKEVLVAAANAYGEEDDKAFMDVPRADFPKDIPAKVGTEIQVQNQAGQPMYARVDRVDEQSLRLNFNHPLAGKELHFSVKVVEIRDATPEEKEHGHVHLPGHQH